MTNELALKVYKILTNKKFRNGPLAPDNRKKIFLENIENKILKNEPIKFLQFWGGSKNINLPIENAELCEKATLDNLKRLNEEVLKIYKPGLLFHIVPGDERVQRINKIPKERTEKYVTSLTELTKKYDGIFQVTPVSVLYQKYRSELESCLLEAKNNLSENVEKLPNFEKLVLNARNNVFHEDITSEVEIMQRSRESARDYCLYRASEEKAGIFREFEDYIRSYFTKYITFYTAISMNFDDISMTRPKLDRSLLYYTGYKGNITQPWQAFGKEKDGKVLFMSQHRV